MKGWPGEPDMDYDVLVADGEAAANAGKPITDVIFDFGNVLIYWDPAAVLIPRYSQKTIDEFLDNDISGFYDVNDLMDGGTSTDEAIAIMRRDRGDKWADILDYYIKNFRDSLTGIVPGARVLVNDLKAAGIGVWGLSNWESSLFHVAEEQCDILQQLDGKLVSGFCQAAQAAQGNLRGRAQSVRYQGRWRVVHRRQGHEHRRFECGRHPWRAFPGSGQAA